MAAIISLLVIIAISLIIVRFGTAALVMTGLSLEVASFQSYSAFFGVGFTTREAEMILSDSTRRRIIKHLMLAGNIGISASVGSVIVAFVKASGTSGELYVLLFIAAGVLALWLLSIAPPVRWLIDRLIKASLKRAGMARPADFALLLRVHAGYVVEEVEVHNGCALIGRMLKESQLGTRGVMVLGCARKGNGTGAGAGANAVDHDDGYIATPTGSFRIELGDVLTVYGQQEKIAEMMR